MDVMAAPTARTTSTALIALDLGAGRVMTISADAHVARVRVVRGTVWATTTPADGDQILRDGDEIDGVRRGPVVLQAVGDASIVLTPRTGRDRRPITDRFGLRRLRANGA